jgi:hypothetical protein
MIRLWKPTLAISVVTLGATFLITGCGSGSTQVRLMNAMNGEGPANMLVNNAGVATDIPYGTASAYESSACGSQPVEITSGEFTLLKQTVTINCGDKNTITATDSGLTVSVDNKAMLASDHSRSAR